MALDKDRLKDKLITAFSNPKTQSNINDVADAIAIAIVDEIKQLKIEYVNGLIAGSTTVTGTLENVTIK